MTQIPAAIDIRIDVLEVEGLSQAGVHRFQRAVERELARLVVGKGLPDSMLEARSIDTIALSWAGSPGVEQVDFAPRLARRIYEGLT